MAPLPKRRRDLTPLMDHVPKHDDDFGTLELMHSSRPLPVFSELIENTIPEFGVGFIGGASGALKTFGILDWLASISTGESIAGREVMREGGVVYIAFEGKDTIDARHRGICIDRDGAMDGAPFYVVRDAKPVQEDHDYMRLEASLVRWNAHMLEAHGKPLTCVAIDTVVAAEMIPPEKENDPAWWQRVFNLLKPIAERLKIVIMLSHHAGKDAEKGLRGSSANHAAADFVVVFETDRDPITGEVKSRWVHLRKTRYGGGEGPIAKIEPAEVVVGTKANGKDMTTLVMRYDTEAKRGKPGKSKDRGDEATVKGAQQKLILEIVDRLVAKGGEDVSTVLEQVGRGLVRDTFVSDWLAVHPETTKDTAGANFRQRVKELLDDGRLMQTGAPQQLYLPKY